MKTPRNGRKITKITQPALAQPPMSCRVNRSPKTVNRSQNHRIQTKNTSIENITSANEYVASTFISFVELEISTESRTCHGPLGTSRVAATPPGVSSHHDAKAAS